MSTERPKEDATPREQPHELNPDQTQALEVLREALHAAQHRTILIHGVTGSGKTEVYIRAIQEVVRFGRQAILLVPGNQSYAANGGPLPRAIRPRRRAPQPLERCRAARALAANRPRRSAGCRRRSQRDLCPYAAFGPDRARRRARIHVQAGVGAAVPRPRRRHPARGRSKRAARARKRHAVARKLASCAAWRISTRRHASAGAQSADACRADDRSPKRNPQQDFARRDQPPAPPRDGRSVARRAAR